MLKPEVEKAILEQIEKEIYSSNLYLSMASWAQSQGFSGTSKWLYAQSDEERLHTIKFICVCKFIPNISISINQY